MMKRYRKIVIFCLFLATCWGGLVTAVSAEMVKKIILFNDGVTPEERSQYAQEWAPQGVATLMDLPFVNGMVLRTPDTITAADLANDYRVASVQDSDQTVTLQAVTATADGGADHSNSPSLIKRVNRPVEGDRPWGVLKLNNAPYDRWAYVDQFDEDAEPRAIKKAVKQVKERQLRIAIFDSGLDINHPHLKGVMEDFDDGIDLVNLDDRFPMDDNGHGTHVAGTLGSKLNGRKFGLIPGAQLYSVKVLDQNAIGDVSAIIMGLQWAIENNIDIINMSVAYAEDNPALRLAVQKAFEAGIVMVAAAGNHSNWDEPAPSASADGGAADGGAADGGAADGGAADGGAADGGAADGGAADGGALADGASGSNPYPAMYPAAYPEVIAVGASDAFDELASFSNTGPEVDLFAPGTEVVSLKMGGGWGVCSGTSMAVPHVTGAAAMMKALDSTLTPAEVQSILVDTAVNDELDLVGALRMVRDR